MECHGSAMLAEFHLHQLEWELILPHIDQVIPSFQGVGLHLPLGGWAFVEASLM